MERMNVADGIFIAMTCHNSADRSTGIFTNETMILIVTLGILLASGALWSD